MLFKIDLNEKKRIIEVVIYGPASHDHHKQARIEAAVLLQHHGFKCLLVNMRELQTKSVISTRQCFDFGTSYSKDGIPADCLIAHVMPTDAIAFRDVEFVSTVASNRGSVIQQFKTPEQAYKWLVSTSQKREKTAQVDIAY
jgi:hypothetical protein